LLLKKVGRRKSHMKGGGKGVGTRRSGEVGKEQGKKENSLGRQTWSFISGKKKT